MVKNVFTSNLELPEWLLEIIGEINHANVKWCFLREPEVIERDAREGADIDLWVEKENATQVLILISNSGWSITSGSCSDSWESPAYSATVRFVRKSNSSVSPQLEIHIGALKWRSFVYLAADIVEQSIHQSDSLHFVNGSALQTILTERAIIKGVFDMERVARAHQHYRLMTTEQKQSWRGNLVKIFGQCRAKIIESWVRKKHSPKLVNVHLYRVKALLLKPAVLFSSGSKTINLVRRILPFTRRVTITFLGPDGSGKSTTISNFKNYLNEKYGNESAISVYWGRARGNTFVLGFFRDIINIFLEGGREEKKNTRVLTYEKSDSSWPPLVYFAATAYLFDYWLRYIFGVFLKYPRKDYVLLDRGPLDISTMRGNEKVLMRIALCGPSQDLVVFCGADSEIIMSRKQERGVDEIIRQQFIFKKVITNSKFGLIVNTGKDTEKVLLYLDFAVQLLTLTKRGSMDKQVVCLALSQLSGTAEI